MISMKLHHSTAQVYVPDGQAIPAALKRVTHLGIGAHQDDLEFMAFERRLRRGEQRVGVFVIEDTGDKGEAVWGRTSRGHGAN